MTQTEGQAWLIDGTYNSGNVTGRGGKVEGKEQEKERKRRGKEEEEK
jgi:hypothetical protein